MSSRMRRLWLTVHRWTALSLGWVVILSGLTGAMLVVSQPLHAWWRADLFAARTVPVADQPTAPLQPILENLRQQFGPEAAFAFNPPKQVRDSLEVMVRAAWRGSVYFDPYTGIEQGRLGESEGFFNALFKWHSSLWMQSTGKALLAWVALFYVALLATGLVLWWPRRWPPVLKLELHKGLLRGLFDLHRTGGALLGGIILISVVTGAYMAWRPLGSVFNWVADHPLETAPAQVVAPATAWPLASLDTIAASAHRTFPDGQVSRIQVPAGQRGLIRVRLKMPDDPHPNGLTSVWIDPVTADVVKQVRWNALDPGTRATAVIYPLHTGVLGGPLLEVIVALSGLALACTGVTGLWLWWRRRSVSCAAKASATQSVRKPPRPIV